MDGFINLDKDSGMSSHQAVAALRRLLRCKAGHAGTLDPLATGVLPICLDKGTRLSEYVMGQNKCYLARVSFGVETLSYDGAGEILACKDASHLCLADVEVLLPRFCGKIMQRPPLISALKRDGQPLYKRVRRGEEVSVEERPVEIFDLCLLDSCFGVSRPYVDLRVTCGKGVYIRSLAHDLGELLGVGAHLSSLRRLAVGEFKAENAYTLAQIEEMQAAGDLSFVLPLAMGVAHLPRFIAPQGALWSLMHGNSWPLAQKCAESEQPLRVESTGGLLLGIGQICSDQEGGSMLKMSKVLAKEPATAKPADYSVVAIGNFDGVHLGHQELMRRVFFHQERLGGKSAVLTFEPHPLTLLKGQAPPLLNTAEEKRELILANGVDELINLNFDEALMNSSPEHFVEDIIIRRFGARQVVVGYNFRFGAGGAGDARMLKQLCGARGVSVEIVEMVSCPEGELSSSNIRRYLLEGNMTAVQRMLGYWYKMSGEVIMGNQLGRQLGFPTANFLPPLGKVLPPCGVYAVRIAWQGRLYEGVANFGFKPTINGGEQHPLVEAHFFDEDLQLYGEKISVSFGSFLRGERQFGGVEELARQIALDSREARSFLAGV